jgi:hypothetical protein
LGPWIKGVLGLGGVRVTGMAEPVFCANATPAESIKAAKMSGRIGILEGF